ncbi:ABC transporter ATP-binding protein [bacterium]|nr:ABC transporter ATP-binding protein [bacterium]
MNKAFQCIDTIKKYPGFQLGPLNLELEPGMVLGFIGPNGSGKSTTLHCLVGLVKTDGGRIEIFGRPNDPRKPDWKYDIGYVGDEHVFYEKWSGEKNLKFIAQFYPDWSDEVAANLARRFDIPLNKPAKELSRGNRVKLSLIAALAHSPKLLLFDEPTSGLDPVVRSEVLDVLFEMMETGERAIFYSTHILSDISRLADELAFVINGRVVLRTAKDDLTDRWRSISFRLAEEHVRFDATVSIHKSGSDHHVVSYDSEATLSQLRALGAQNIMENRMSIDEIAVQILKEEKNHDSDS